MSIEKFENCRSYGGRDLVVSLLLNDLIFVKNMNPRRAIPYIQFILLAIGAGLTINGLLNLTWPQAISWGSGRLRFILFLVIAFSFVSIFTRRLHWKPFQIVAIGTVLLAGVSGALWPLLVVFWFALASSILGQWVLRKLGVESNDRLIHFLIGGGIYGTAVGLLAHFPVNYPVLYGAALALPLVLQRLYLSKYYGEIRYWITQRTYADKQNIPQIVIAVVALVHIVVAFMPELGFDALAMHLFIPAHLATRHQWGFDASTYVWAVMPTLGDWIFSVVYMLGGETAVRLINIGFILVIARLVGSLVLWAGGTTRGAYWATLVFLSSPLTFTESSSAFIESIWASFVVGGTIATLRACSTTQSNKNQLILMGLLLGMALAAKAVTFTVLPVLLLVLVWHYRAWLKSDALAPLAYGIMFFLIFGSVPYVTAWWLTGNPVFPFFNKIFQSPLWPAINFDSSSVFGKGVTWDVLYRITFQSEKYLEAHSGAGGFQWLLLFLPALATLLLLRHRQGIWLFLVGGLSVALAFQSVSYLRYVFPAWAILTAVIGVGMSIDDYTTVYMRKIWRGAAFAAISLNVLFLNAAANYGDFGLKSIFSESDRDRYLSERLPLRTAVDLVNELNPGRTPVAVFAHPLVAGLKSDGLYANWYNYGFQEAINAAKSEQEVADVLLSRGSDFVILDSGWNGIGGQLNLVGNVTTSIAEFGPVTVRKIKAEYRFKKELLLNPNFLDIKGWTLIGDAKLNSEQGTVVTTVSSPAVQVIQVVAGRRYLDTVTVRCVNGGAEGRAQVNWSDAKGVFISTDIRTFACAPEWKKHEMEVVAPKNAVNAAVYASAHSEVPIEFKEVSFRQ